MIAKLTFESKFWVQLYQRNGRITGASEGAIFAKMFIVYQAITINHKLIPYYLSVKLDIPLNLNLHQQRPNFR